ncbi:hypothetical protein ACFXPV_30735 [Streptomyces sp. NPDC059118]|uniref:hypothetical protein n=1 Tax=Streptomyces sp. NPDC059118 TaxID=3346731 RepID=UPI0036B22BCC
MSAALVAAATASAALLGPVRTPGLGFGLLGAAQHRQGVVLVLADGLLRGLELGVRVRVCSGLRIGLQGGHVGDLQELLPRGGGAVLDGSAGPGDGGRDAGRVAQVGGPGRREETGLTDQALGLTTVVARLAQPGRPAAPAVLARQRLADRVGGGRSLPLTFRLLSGCRASRIAPGPLPAGLLLAPSEVFRTRTTASSRPTARR